MYEESEPKLLHCKKCGKKVLRIEGDNEWEYSEEYDSYYCKDCLEWVNKRCFCGKDGECAEFPNRPEKPWKDME